MRTSTRRHALTKSQSQRIHAKRRFESRYGFHLNKFDYRDIVSACKSQSKKVMFIKSDSFRAHHYLIQIKGALTQVVYDSDRKELITFLYPEQKDIKNFINKIRKVTIN